MLGLQQPVCGFPFQLDRKCRDGELREGYPAGRPMVLGRPELQMAVYPLRGLSDEERPEVEVAVLPSQAKRLTSAETSRQGYDEEALEPVTSESRQDFTSLLGCQNPTFRSRQ